MKAQVFISHASEESAKASYICQYLESLGFSCWMAPRNIRPGRNYATQIVKAIQKASVFVLLVSKSSSESENVNNELELAARSKILMIPFMIETLELTNEFLYFLGRKQWIDATESMDKALKELANSLGETLDMPAPVAVEDPPTKQDVITAPAVEETIEARDVDGLIKPMTVIRRFQTYGGEKEYMLYSSGKSDHLKRIQFAEISESEGMVTILNVMVGNPYKLAEEVIDQEIERLSLELNDDSDDALDQGEFITMEDEDGVLREFEILHYFTLESNGKDYLVYSREEEAHDGDIIVYTSEVVEKGDEVELVGIEDEKIMEEIEQILLEIAES